MLAVTHDGRIPLVRQFRPALEKETLELPSGLVDPGESPEAAGRRELNEETGFVAVHLLSLGRTFVDSGRMPTPQWGYFAPDVRAGDAAAGSPGEDIEVVLVAPDDFRRLIADGELAVAAQTGVVSTALARGVFSF